LLFVGEEDLHLTKARAAELEVPLERRHHRVRARLERDARDAGAERREGEGTRAELVGQQQRAVHRASDARRFVPRADGVEDVLAAELAPLRRDALAERLLAALHRLFFDL